jgi:hypothetical protein
MSVASISLVVAIRPSENEGSAVLSIRSMTGFASATSEISEAVGLSVPSKMTLRETGSACRCREYSWTRRSTLEVVLTLIQNSLEHKPVEFKVHVYVYEVSRWSRVHINTLAESRVDATLH